MLLVQHNGWDRGGGGRDRSRGGHGSFQRMGMREVAVNILNGSLQRSDKAKRLADSDASELDLQRQLEPEHFRLLSNELLGQVRQCFSDQNGPGLVALEKRVTELAKWDFADLGRYVHLRAKWLSAWLAERLDRKTDAIARYGEFIAERLPTEETVLGLLADNNQAVLRLQRGDLSCLDALARVALGEDLPGACFSLFNVIQILRRKGSYAEMVEPTLHSVIKELKLEHQWLQGGDSQTEAGSTGEPSDPSPSRARKTLDLDKLVRHLATRTCKINDQAISGDGLYLWSEPEQGLIASLAPDPLETSGLQRHAAYSEAVSLLYACDFPDALPLKTRTSNRAAIISGTVAEAREHAGKDQFEEAQAAIEQARRLIKSSPHPKQFARLETEMEKTARELKERKGKLQEEELLSELARLRERVDKICELTGVEDVRNQRQFLWPFLRKIHRLERELWPGEATDLAAPLERRLTKHVEQLEATRRKEELDRPLQRLKNLMPKDLDLPVEEEAYQVLKLCRTADPGDTEEDWSGIKAALDQHNGRHHFRKAFDMAGRAANSSDFQAIEQEIKTAIGWDRSIAARAAPLVALINLVRVGGDEESLDALRQKLLKVSEDLVQKEVLGGGQVVPPQVRVELMYEALADLQRAVKLFMRQKGDRQMAEQMFKHLDNLFRPALEDGDSADVLAVCDMLSDWQTVWPDFFLPDHPFHALQEKSEVAYLIKLSEEELREAERKRNAEKKNTEEHGDAVEQAIRDHLDRAHERAKEAIEKGVWDARQAEAAVTYYALSRQLADLRRVEKDERLKWLLAELRAAFGTQTELVTPNWLDESLNRSVRGLKQQVYEDPEKDESESKTWTPSPLDKTLREMQLADEQAVQQVADEDALVTEATLERDADDGDIVGESESTAELEPYSSNSTVANQPAGAPEPDEEVHVGNSERPEQAKSKSNESYNEFEDGTLPENQY